MARRRNAYDTIIKPNLDNIRYWLREGYSHKQICEMLGISQKTFHKYQEEDKPHSKSAFIQVLTTTKQGLQIKLEDALYRESIGYDYKETQEKYENGKLTEEKIIKKTARPNSNLLIFALVNKYPKEWKRVDKEITDGPIEIKIVDNIDAIRSGKKESDESDKNGK